MRWPVRDSRSPRAAFGWRSEPAVPEGDTVWLAGRHLHAALATTDLRGSTVAEVVPRGKHLLFRFAGGPGDGLTLHTHFRMDGSWHLYGDGQRWHGGPQHQIRAILTVAGTSAVGYRLPVMELLPTADEGGVIGHLGPDLLDPDVDLAAAAQGVSGQPERVIGDVLLDQGVVAGVGNLYRAETCFLAGVTPFMPVAELAAYGTSAAAVLAIARKLLTVNADRAVQVTTGLSRRDAQHWVFERRACLRCGTRVSTAMSGVAPRQRVAYWCPACQRGPAPPAVPISQLLPRTVGRTRYRP